MSSPRMVSRDDVLRQLATQEAAANPNAPVEPAASLATTHISSAIEALGLLGGREVRETSELLAYAQTEALLAIALTLADLRHLLERGKP